MNTHHTIQLQNAVSSMSIDLYGGAITDFHLHQHPVNPLSFRFGKEQMPENNKEGACYQGHFVCGGRWGLPSQGEIAAGMPNHGEPANIEWSLTQQQPHRVVMEVHAEKEGLHIYRTINMHEHSSFIHVSETIKNTRNLGRLYQYVQHPTVAAPFLTPNTQVNCNAAKGFDYRHIGSANKPVVQWPYAMDETGNTFDLQRSDHAYNAVFSFTVADTIGWITAYTPEHNLVLGYVWNTEHYNWINLWQQYKGSKIQYRGLEFGNTGLHQPFKEIIANNTLEMFGSKTIEYIDAGESVHKAYWCFLAQVPTGFHGIDQVVVEDNALYLKEGTTAAKIFAGNLNA